jgi:hypothetical protein
VNSRFVRVITAAAVVATLTLGAMLALAEDAPAAAAKTHAYVGSKSCKTCHSGEKKGAMWEKWMSTAHSKSMASLDSTKGQNKDPKCLACHTTGYGMTGGYKLEGLDAAMMAPEGLGAVGCESCHGAGADYKSMTVMKNKDAAMAAGLVTPDAKVCTGCHNVEAAKAAGTTIKPFDWATMHPLIEHHVPKVDSTK